MKRAHVLTVLFFFILQQSFLYPEPAQQETKSPASVNDIQIPESIGMVRERVPGARGPLVVCVEEAHAELDAEMNIRNILHELQKNHGLETVGVEAAFTELEPTFLRAFPNKAVMEKTLVDFVKRGEFSGVEMAAVLNEKPARYAGIEVPELYEKEHALFVKALENQPKILLRLDRIQALLVRLKSILYEESFLKLDEKIEAFENSGAHLLPLLKEISEKHELDGKALPQIVKLIQILHGAEAVEKEPLRGQAERFVITMKREISERLKNDREGLKEFQGYVQAHATERLPLTSFIAYLARKGSSLGIDLAPYPSLKPYFEEPEILQSIESWSFMKEFDTLLREVKEEELKGKESAQTLDRLYHYLKILNQTARLKVERKDLEEYKSERSAFQEEKFWDFIQSHLPTVDRPKESVPLEELLAPALSFYETAFEREKVMYEKVKKLLQESPNQFVAVTSGGFHTEGFADRFRQDGTSYCVITPVITKFGDPDVYLNAILEKKPSYARWFEASAQFYAARRKIDPTNVRFRAVNLEIASEALEAVTDGMERARLVSDWVEPLVEDPVWVGLIGDVVTTSEKIPRATDLATFREVLDRQPSTREFYEHLANLEAALRYRGEVQGPDRGRLLVANNLRLDRLFMQFSPDPNQSAFLIIDEHNVPETWEETIQLLRELGPRGRLSIRFQHPEKVAHIRAVLDAIRAGKDPTLRPILDVVRLEKYDGNLLNQWDLRREVAVANSMGLHVAVLFAELEDVPEDMVKEGAIPFAFEFNPDSTREFAPWLKPQVLKIVPRAVRMTPDVQGGFLLEISGYGFMPEERGKGRVFSFTLSLYVNELIEKRDAILAALKAA